MILWPTRDTLEVLIVGKRLGVLLLAVTVYYLGVGRLVQWFEIPENDGGQVGSLINALILSLLMGFRNRTAYARWWEARGLWGQLTNDSRNLAAKCATFVPADAVSASRFAEILAAFPFALKRHLRSAPFHLNEIPGFEHETDDPPHVPLYLARRLYGEMAKWKAEGKIDLSVLLILDRHVRGLMDVCGGCEKIRSTPLSTVYKGLLRTGLLLNVLVAPWVIVPENGLWSLPMVLLACFFFFGVELIDSIVEEPFGHDRDDLDLERYCNTIRDGVGDSLPLPPVAG